MIGLNSCRKSLFYGLCCPTKKDLIFLGPKIKHLGTLVNIQKISDLVLTQPVLTSLWEILSYQAPVDISRP